MRKPLLLRQMSVDFPRAQACAEALASASLKPVGRAFAQNVETSIGIVSVPGVFLRFSYDEIYQQKRYLQEFMKATNDKGAPPSESEVRDIQRSVDDEILALRGSREWQEGKTPEVQSYQEHLIDSVPRLRVATDAIVHAAIVNAWTSFETLALDVWEAAVNERPGVLAIRALDNLGSKARKMLESAGVSAGAVTKHGLDSSRDIGRVLSDRFRFRSLTAITEAYESIFRCSERDLLFDQRLTAQGESAEVHIKTLRRLEATRHMLVHRAGIVDQRYKDETGSEAGVGTQFDPEEPELPSLLNVAVFCGCALLEFADRWLTEHPEENPVEGPA